MTTVAPAFFSKYLILIICIIHVHTQMNCTLSSLSSSNKNCATLVEYIYNVRDRKFCYYKYHRLNRPRLQGILNTAFNYNELFFE